MTARLLSLISALFLSAFPASADVSFDMIQLYGHALKTCIKDASPNSDLSECRNLLVEACQQGEPFGYTIFGSSRCSAAESRVWGEVMDQKLADLARWAEMADQLQLSDPNAKKLYITRAENLENAQAAWWDYRNSQCRLVRNLWDGTRMAGAEESACRLKLVQERVSQLQRVALDAR